MIDKKIITIILLILLFNLFSGCLKEENSKKINDAQFNDLILELRNILDPYNISMNKIEITVRLTNNATHSVMIPKAFDITNSLNYYLVYNNSKIEPLLSKAQPTNEKMKLEPKKFIETQVDLKYWIYINKEKENFSLIPGNYKIQFYYTFTEPDVYSEEIYIKIK